MSDANGWSRRERGGARLRFAIAAALSLALSTPVAAQTPDEIKAAKQTAGEALDAYNAGQFDKALALFEKARVAYPSAQVLRMIGYSELALEHWMKAMEALEAALEAKITPLSKDDRKDVQEQMAKVMAHIGTVAVTTSTPGAKLSIDGGEPRALPLDKPLRLQAGTRKLVVTAPDHLDAASEIKIEGGKQANVALDPKVKPAAAPALPPPPPPKPDRKEWVPHQRVVGAVTTGAGVAFGAAALGTFLTALHWRSLANADVKAHQATYGNGCAMGDPRLCAFDIEVTNREGDRANQLRNAAAGLGAAAAALTVTGVVFLVAAPKNDGTPADAAPPRTGSAPPRVASPSAAVGFGIAGGPGIFVNGSF